MRLLLSGLLAFCLLLSIDARVTKKYNPYESNESDEAITKARVASKSTCGYDSCPITKEGVLNVHIIAHTHDDVGWLKTVDQYYYGSRTMTQKAGVQYILDSVIESLSKDPTRRFIYVETAFFWKWWQEQTDVKRHYVKKLVNEGRLEFVGGAWSMNDEATVHYQSVIDQFTWGLRKLNDTFGECGRPRVGWQIDPFGHSKEQANLFAGMGYDGLLLGRIDYQDKLNRRQKKSMEMVWQASQDLGSSGDLFTGIMFNTYSPPPGFCFDVLCSDDPVIDDPTSPDYNVDQMVASFMEYLALERESYRTDHITITMGGDFTYIFAEQWFKNLDKLIKYVNQKHPNEVNLFYSTPSCYLKSLHDSNMKWPTKKDDFFPYASDPNSYWTGYFTSRPTLKYFERKSNNFLQVCKQLYAMTNLNEQDRVDLNALRSVMGVMQHHDAVTGTEKQHVAQDYARMLDVGIQDCLITSRDALNHLMSEKPSSKDENNSRRKNRDEPIPNAVYLPVELCELNMTSCPISEKSSKFVVTVYNPLAHVVNHYVKVPVSGQQYTVQDPEGKEVTSQIIPVASSMNEQLQDVRNSSANNELVFIAANLPPVGYRAYFITEVKSSDEEKRENVKNPSDHMVGDEAVRKTVIIEKELDNAEEIAMRLLDEEFTIGNDFIQISADTETGMINKLFVAKYNMTIPLRQQLMYYEGAAGNNEVFANRSSGAYIFRPRNQTAFPIAMRADVTVYRGALVEEIHQKFGSWASQVVRVYKDDQHVEFEWLVGPIPIEDSVGKEVISRFDTDFKTNGLFYTDSNGRQLLERKINYRPTWNLTLEEPVGGNYYPVTNMIAMHDETSGMDMSVVTDRAQGGSSLFDGSLEIMIHRRLLRDDAFGVGEALNETENGRGLVAKGTHYLYVGKPEAHGSFERRQLILLKQLEPILFFASADNFSISDWQKSRNEFSGLVSELPANVHLLTLEPWRDDTVLVRFEHYLQKDDDPDNLSKNVKFRLDRVFSDIEILSVRETTLAGNQWLDNSNRMQWEVEDEVEPRNNEVLPENKEKKYFIRRIDSLQHEMDEQNYKIAQIQERLNKFASKHHLKLNKEKNEKLSEYLNEYKFSAEIPIKNDETKSEKVNRNLEDMEIELSPMQIRTFIIRAKFLD